MRLGRTVSVSSIVSGAAPNANGRLFISLMMHYYAWKNNPKRITLYRRPCRVLAYGSLGSILIEFENGQREIVSRRAIRRL